VTVKGPFKKIQDYLKLDTGSRLISIDSTDSDYRNVPKPYPGFLSGDESGNYPGNGGGDCAGRTLETRRAVIGLDTNILIRTSPGTTNDSGRT